MRRSRMLLGRLFVVLRSMLVLLLSVQLFACGKSDLKDQVKKKADERAAAAESVVGEAVKKYVDGLVGTLPSADVKPSKDVKWPLRTWKKEAVANAKMAEYCAAKADELSDTPAAVAFTDGKLLFEAVHHHWVGRELIETKKKDAQFEDSPDKGPKSLGRERSELPEFVANMKQLGRGDDSPWRVVADFELLMPHLLKVNEFRMYRGVIQDTSFSPVWQIMFEFARTRDDEGPEQFGPYRNRLCKEKLGEACNVNYEYRDVAVRKIYLEKVDAAVKAFRVQHPDSGLEPVLDYFGRDLADELSRAVIPEEYPVLSSTRRGIWTSVDTFLIVGPKGAILESDDPKDQHKRLSVKLMDPRDSWDLDTETAQGLVDSLAKGITDMRDNGAQVRATTVIYYHFDRSVPAKLIGQLTQAYKPAGLKAAHFVARRRYDGQNALRRVPAQSIHEEALRAVTLTTPLGVMKCMPVGSLNDSDVVPEGITHYVAAKGGKVVAGKSATAAVSAPLGGDLEPLSKFVNDEERPTIIAIDAAMTNEQMHEVLSAIAFNCGDEACERPNLVSGLLLSVCDYEMPEPPPEEKKKK